MSNNTTDLDKYHDEQGITQFARLMKDKLAKKRLEGRGGWWRSCRPVDLAKMLREHLAKGDPVDIANFAMMLFRRADGPAALRTVFADLADERYGHWRSIETAPRDGTKLDIWVVPPSERGAVDYPISATASGCRIPDAKPCYSAAWQSSEGRTVTGRRYYDCDGDECFDPDDISVRATRATHWMPQPKKPEENDDAR